MLLSELDENELANIWTQCLRMKPEDEFFAEGSQDHKVIVISKEWRAVHGHTLANRFRSDHELPWKRILIDVADKLKPGLGWTDFRMDDGRSEEEIERQILEFFDQIMKERWEKMSEKERQEKGSTIDESLDHTDEVISAKASFAGLPPVPLALPHVAEWIVMASVSPMSTSYRKTIPATLYLLGAHELRRQLAAMEDIR